MRSKRFLVVDDSPAVIKRLSLILEALGHEVIGSACNGLDAIAKAGQLQPDAITMDIQMPELDGLEATRRILQDHPDKPVIIITAHGQESTVVDAIGAGAKYFICKPIEKDKVDEVLRKVFRDE
ncbi:response regulator [Chromobacterium sp. IIBBL 290-4]|uniref:response regulator n=1 Tax=Chromobacterium sp. IIBBL 290-4 TaxID=2953890 RepID=UPI0020B63AC6|nr:response regulator [Chromobacterium sp. IIBBL 290-4]UTH74661.1 response regulator [Chromobacterium sp. IIBBL 290-4]